jgi:hypothetical protein
MVQIDYRRPSSEGDREEMVVALLLCVPGICAWILFVLNQVDMPDSVVSIYRAILWPIIITALLSAAFSVVFYLRVPARRWHVPWYVTFNLMFNSLGLISFLAMVISVL